MADRFSNGDENKITIVVKNELPFVVDVEVIDELPEQFQIRDWRRKVRIKANEKQRLIYSVKPF